jgi:hypothetical protein
VNEAEICSIASDPIINAVLAAEAYAEALAASIITYSAHVCSCCQGNSKAYTSVQSSVQAVATASASAFSSALASLSCNDELLAGASSSIQALAVDTQVAIDKVYKQYVSQGGKDCRTVLLQSKLKSAIAKAAACTFLNVYAAYDVFNDVASALSCSASVPLSGKSENYGTCQITNCPLASQGSR